MAWLSFRVIFSDFSGNVCTLRAKRMLKYISGEQDVRISFSSRIFLYLNYLSLEQIPHKTSYSLLLQNSCVQLLPGVP